MANTHFKGPIISDNGFTGAITGNVTGDVTGNVTGDVTGNLTGNVTGNVTGDVTGNVTGNQSGGSVAATTATASTSLAVGSGGATIKAIKTGTVALDPPDTADGDVSAAFTGTITGVAAGDIVICVPPAADLTALLMSGPAVVTGADTISVRLVNGSGGNVNEGSASWTYLWFDLT